MAMSDVIGGVPAPSISITSITSLGGGNWELTLEGEASTGYEFYSSPILDFTPGDLVINLTQGDPGDPGDISGDNSEVLTTDGNGDGTARMTLSGSPADFVRVQTAPPPPPLFSEDFEGGDGGFTVAQQATGDLWAHGDPPDSDNGVTDPVDGGNGGSMGCWGTDITNPGFYGPDTSTCLRSVDIDLSDAASAFLTFAEVLDLQSPHTAVVNIIEAVGVGDAVLATAIHNSDPDPDINDTQWAPANGGADIEIPPGVLGQTVRIEWRLDGDGTEVDGYLGWYIDDVVVKKVPNTP